MNVPVYSATESYYSQFRVKLLKHMKQNYSHASNRVFLRTLLSRNTRGKADESLLVLLQNSHLSKKLEYLKSLMALSCDFSVKLTQKEQQIKILRD